MDISLRMSCLVGLLLISSLAAAAQGPSPGTAKAAKAEIAAIDKAMAKCDAGDNEACKEVSVHYMKLNALGYCSKGEAWYWCADRVRTGNAR